jgi:hypothetical protein
MRVVSCGRTDTTKLIIGAFRNFAKGAEKEDHGACDAPFLRMDLQTTGTRHAYHNFTALLCSFIASLDLDLSSQF